jgi:glucuronoxylan 4-O-methyltransferase
MRGAIRRRFDRLLGRGPAAGGAEAGRAPVHPAQAEEACGATAEALEALAAGLRADLCAELGVDTGALEGVQLEAGELRPIVTAIRARPGCALLVFGCGRDARFWERVNGSGTTAFLEDDPQWASAAEAGLTTASVHLVAYGTTLADWRRLLDRPSELAQGLPEAIGARRWDVILVDGPAGWEDSKPGRMKSIHWASRLVARDGCVFVHDCERPAERAFAGRYLRAGRLFVEVRGRALLRGYAF